MEIDQIETGVKVSNPAYDINEESEKSKTPAQPHTDINTRQQTQQPTEQLALDHSFRFGWGRISGDWLQLFNKPRFFLLCSSFAVAASGFVRGGIFLGSITSIERQFGYKSSEVATFGLAYEAAVGALSVFLGYFGNLHKPRCIALSLVVMAGEYTVFCKKLMIVINPPVS